MRILGSGRQQRAQACAAVRSRRWGRTRHAAVEARLGVRLVLLIPVALEGAAAHGRGLRGESRAGRGLARGRCAACAEMRGGAGQSGPTAGRQCAGRVVGLSGGGQRSACGALGRAGGQSSARERATRGACESAACPRRILAPTPAKPKVGLASLRQAFPARPPRPSAQNNFPRSAGRRS